MASRRSLIRDACVTALQTLNLAGGVQQLRRSNTFATLPTVIVAQLGEDKGLPAPTSKISARLELAVDAFPEATAADLAPSIDDLVTSIEAVLLAQNQNDPPLGVLGVEEITLGGHEVFALEEEGLVGASLQVTVRYRHDIDDPTTFEEEA